MIPGTISRHSAQRIYDLIGARYDWIDFYESAAKDRAFEYLELKSGLRLLNVGAGTGKEHKKIEAAVKPNGVAVALDLSSVMVSLAHNRTFSPVLQADAGKLPITSRQFDRLYAAYVLDILPAVEIPDILAGFMRVLKPGGKLVIISMTEGADTTSRAVVKAWKWLYKLSPQLCAGCRPLQLGNFVGSAGFRTVDTEVVVQWAVASEVLTAYA